MPHLKRRRKKGLSKRSGEHKLTNSREMLASWRSGSLRESKIGSKTWLTRRRENRANSSLSTNRHKNLMK
jgi:hypothetical protein